MPRKKDQQLIIVPIILNENIKQELDKIKFAFELPAELQIQEDLEMYLKKEKKTPKPHPPYTSTPPINEKEINKIYNETKEDCLETAITINKTNLDAASENADEKNKKIISKIINPTPGLFVDNQLNLEYQFKYKSNNIERSFALTNQTQQRLDNALRMMIKNNRPPAEMIKQKTNKANSKYSFK